MPFDRPVAKTLAASFIEWIYLLLALSDQF